MKILLYFLCIITPACSPRYPRLHHFRGIAMEMPYHIQIGKSLSVKQQTRVQAVIDSSFVFIHQCFDHWNPKSELSLLNELPILESKKLSPKLLQLFQIADSMVEMSGSRYNPTLGNIISLWKKSSAVLDQKDLKSIQQSLQWGNISLRDGVFSKRSNLVLDFDGIAKGLGIDLLLERLEALGYTNIYVEWAGDIAACGNHPSGRPWQVAIRNPLSQMPDSEIIPLNNCAIATSGDYEQYIEIDNKQYCHIIDPKSLRPIEVTQESIASVTVMAPSCALADGLATTAMTFTDLEALLSWAHEMKEKIPRVSFRIFKRDNVDGEIKMKKYVVSESK